MMWSNPVSVLRRIFPIFEWSSDYNVNKAVADLVAGITNGLTLISQSLAYASLAGLEPQYGLYSSLCGGIIYVIFGTIPELNIAPTALLSLLTYSYTHHISFDNIHAAILLTFLGGAVELLCGVLHLGFLVDFVSTPVVAAFTSAGALTIASSQVKNLFGLKYSAESFIDIWKKFFIHVSEIQKWDTILGVSCCVILLSMRKLKDFGEAPLENSSDKGKHKSSTLKKLIWFSSVARNAFVVIACAVMTYFLSCHDIQPFSLTSKVPAGWPNISLPAFSLQEGNRTITFTDMVKELGTGILVIPFIAILGNVAIAKAFARGKVVDASQEMVAVGVCNLVGSFFGSYPVNASFSRAAVSNASGVKTPLAGIYTGTMVIMALTFLTPYFSYIPKASLSAVIICAVLFMVEVAITKMIWQHHKMELVTFTITLVTSLVFGIEVGIMIGVFVDIIFLLYSTARPKVLVEKVEAKHGTGYVKVTPTSSILFPSAEYIRERIIKSNVEAGNNSNVIVIDCHRITNLDFTAGKCMGSLVADLRKNGKTVIFSTPKPFVANVIGKACKSVPIVHTEEELQSMITDKNGLNSTKNSQNTPKKDEDSTQL